MKPEVLPLGSGHALRHLFDDLVRQTRPDLFAGLVHPRVEPHGRPPVAQVIGGGFVLVVCGTEVRLQLGLRGRSLRISRVYLPDQCEVRDPRQVASPRHARVALRYGNPLHRLVAEMNRPQLIGGPVPQRSLQAVANHPHQRGLTRAPRSFDSDRQRRLCLWVLNPAGDRLGIGGSADSVNPGPSVAADRRLFVAHQTWSVGNAVDGHVLARSGLQYRDCGDRQKGAGVPHHRREVVEAE